MKTIALKLNTPFSTIANLIATSAGLSEDDARRALSSFTMSVQFNGETYTIVPAAATVAAEVKMSEEQTKLRDTVLVFVRMSPTETVRMSALVKVAGLDAGAVTTMIGCSDSTLRFYSTGKGAGDDKVIGKEIVKVAKPSPEAPAAPAAETTSEETSETPAPALSAPSLAGAKGKGKGKQAA